MDADKLFEQIKQSITSTYDPQDHEDRDILVKLKNCNDFQSLANTMRESGCDVESFVTAAFQSLGLNCHVDDFCGWDT